jgi:hypothetical protein
MDVLGAVWFRGNMFHDDEILQLKDKKVGAYGCGWTYAGDQSFEEASILVSNDAGKEYTFYGRLGLNDFIFFLKLTVVS